MVMAIVKLKLVGNVSDSFLAGLVERFPGIIAVNRTYGPYDIVIKLEASTEEELTKKIRLVTWEFKLIRSKEISITA